MVLLQSGARLHALNAVYHQSPTASGYVWAPAADLLSPLTPHADRSRLIQLNAETMQRLWMQVHSRVKLAVKIDEVQHSQSKQKAEMSWRRRNAEQVGA